MVYKKFIKRVIDLILSTCLLYTSDAADERSSVDLGGRRIIKKKKTVNAYITQCDLNKTTHTINNIVSKWSN